MNHDLKYYKYKYLKDKNSYVQNTISMVNND